MAENRLIIELTYSNRGDGDWSHQIDIFRQIEIERLAAEEEILPSEERLDADDATGGTAKSSSILAMWSRPPKRWIDAASQRRRRALTRSDEGQTGSESHDGALSRARRVERTRLRVATRLVSAPWRAWPDVRPETDFRKGKHFLVELDPGHTVV
jgi:hypothetical protein